MPAGQLAGGDGDASPGRIRGVGRSEASPEDHKKGPSNSYLDGPFAFPDDLRVDTPPLSAPDGWVEL
jgi:hypothetical protein